MEKHPKVLHINCNYILTQLHQLLIRNLTALGVDNCVYSQIAYGVKGIVTPDENVIVSECFNRRDRYVFYYKQWKILRDIKKHYDFKEFDCIHAYTLFTDGNTAMQLSKEYGLPYVVAVRDTDVNTFFKKAFWLRNRGIEILEKASCVFFLSKTYKDTLLKKYVPANKREEISRKSRIVPNGIDQFWLDNINYEKDFSASTKLLGNKCLHAVFVGVLSKRKNVVTTIKAIEILKQKGWDVKFTVIGKAEDPKQVEAVRNSLETKYIGPKSKEEILTYFRDADVFIMPSITETFGLTYAEAISQGLPVIYSRGQGFDGQFEDGIVGYSVDCFSPEEIVEKIVQITGDYVRISKNCLAKAARFNWYDIAKTYKTVYELIIEEIK